MSETRRILTTKFLHADYYPGKKIVLISADAEYIPEIDFKDAFQKVRDYIATNDTEKIIFDKSNLKVFHQASMTWYHVIWKKDLLDSFGITQHRKILPEDELFKQSVQIGRERIKHEHPDFHFDDYNIIYKDSLEKALAE